MATKTPGKEKRESAHTRERQGDTKVPEEAGIDTRNVAKMVLGDNGQQHEVRLA